MLSTSAAQSSGRSAKRRPCAMTAMLESYKQGDILSIPLLNIKHMGTKGWLVRCHMQAFALTVLVARVEAWV